MPTQERTAPQVEETDAEVVIRLELTEPGEVAVDQLTAALDNRILEIRMPRRQEPSRRFVGFHPDAPAS